MLAGLAVAAALVVASPVVAQPQGPSKAELRLAKQAYAEGATAYQLGRFKEAARLFEEAYRITRYAAMLFDIGQCYRRLFEQSRDLAHLRKALDLYRAFLREAPANASKRPAAEELVPRLEQSLEAEIRRRREALVTQAQGSRGLRLADRLMSEGALKDAALVLDRVIATRGNSRNVLVAALTKRGLVAGRLNDQSAATALFKKVLALDPGFIPPSTAGATGQAFAAAKRFWQGHQPLTIGHLPPGSVEQNQAARIPVAVESDPLGMISRLAVYFRLAGQGAYSVSRSPVSGGAAEIPITFLGGLKGGTRVEYYVVALNETDAALATLGSPTQPFVIQVALAVGPIRDTPPPVATTPWYKKWWVWTIAAGVAAGAGVGIYYGTRSDPFNPPPVHVPTP